MDVVIDDTADEPPSGSEPLSGQGDYYRNSLIALGFSPENLPLAEFLSLYHHLQGHWLIASPIHWEATHNDAMIVATARELELTEQESRLWFNEVAQFLKEDGFAPVFHDAQTWLFKLENKPQIASRSLHAMLHQSLMPILSSLDQSLYWQRLITELQMYLSAHPLNEQRKTKLPINGIWFWGEGEFKIGETKPIATDDPVFLDLGSKQISPLTPTTDFEKNQVLIIKDVKQIALCNLDDKIRKNNVHWYWNNIAYSTRVSHWWSRLWR